eukprot:gene22909-29086_t
MPGNTVAVNTDYLAQPVAGATLVQPGGYSMSQMPVQTAVVSNYSGYSNNSSGGYESSYAPQQQYYSEDNRYQEGRAGGDGHYNQQQQQQQQQHQHQGDEANSLPSDPQPKTAPSGASPYMPPLLLPQAGGRTVSCLIPPGVGPGNSFIVTAADGTHISVVVPDDMYPGQELTIAY